MHVRRHATLLGSVAAGLLVSVAALPAFAATAPTSTVPGKTAACTAARSAQEAYRVGTVVPLAEEWDDRVAEVEELLAVVTDEVADAQAAVGATGEAVAAAELAVTAAEATLEEAETGGDADEIEDAEAALAAAVAESAAAAGAAATALAASDQAQLDLLSVEAELVETRATSQFVTAVSLGRGFETEEQVEDHLVALRAADLDEYAVLVEELAVSCFVYVDEAQDEDRNPVADAPAAAPATPVRARASYTG